MVRLFDGQRKAKLGTEKHPLFLLVQTKERQEEVSAICEDNGWYYEVEIDSDRPEDISDLELLTDRPTTVVSKQKIGRNEPCPCGSGKKYKKCCGKA